MKVVITGGNGFLAGYVIDAFVQEKYEIVILARKNGERKGITYTLTDYTYQDLIQKTKGCDAIVHLASTRKIYDNLSDYYPEINMTQALYDAAKDNGIGNIIYASSISVYSGGMLPYSEEQLICPNSMYGLSKVIGEQIGLQYNAKYGMKIKNFRFAHIYGANENNNYMINVFFKKAFSKEQIIVNSKGIAKREFLYAKDAASAILTGLSKSDLEGTFNIGSNDYLTNQEVGEIICSVMSPDMRVIVGCELETIHSSFMCNKNAMEKMGYFPKYTLKRATEEIQKQMITA